MTHPHFPYPVQIKDDETELFLVVDGHVCPYPVRFFVGTTFLVDSVERPDPSVGIFGDNEYTLERDGLFFIYVGHDFFDDYDVGEDGGSAFFPGRFEFVPVYCPGTEIPLDDNAGADQGCSVCGNYQLNFKLGDDGLFYHVTHDADPGLVALYLRRTAERSS